MSKIRVNGVVSVTVDESDGTRISSPLANPTLDIPDHLPEPVMVVDGEFLERRSRFTDVITVDIEDGNSGVRARFWVSARIVKGRPVLGILTKIGDASREVSKSVTGTFNRL